ncbi:MAG: DinB family protein [Candidatus Krumholzibacteria bacterium]|nr:DinB family protein [Candidatus Krumholzibacteria bacterium]MDH4338478.1 DinB family protein [Candidatus Krumholzibacteria bacterium]MDH5270994.1 DinB family protein [Candidatus Krumholzibacteria bacterium]
MIAREIKRLEEQLKRALEGEAWHGPSVLESLAGVSAHEAAAHPISGAHSIWEIVLHLTTDYGLVLRRLSGDGRQLTPEENWPPCPAATEENWRKAAQDLTKLNPLVSEVPYTAYTQFIGVTQHGLYHAGQIALLKRALRTG